MTDNEIRQIFSRFQNLNLIVLIEDLRRRKVARGTWNLLPFECPDNLARLCPVGHGWRDNGVKDCGYCEIQDFQRAGLTILDGFQLGTRFTDEWDGKRITNRQLAAILRSILRERQEDADCVQAITGAVVGQEAMVSG